jgi:hypothetical protein
VEGAASDQPMVPMVQASEQLCVSGIQLLYDVEEAPDERMSRKVIALVDPMICCFLHI